MLEPERQSYKPGVSSSLQRATRRAGGPRQPRAKRLRCEALEDRRLLAITVDTLLDEADGSIEDGDVSLRDAIALAPSGETIDFDTSLNGGTILLTQGELSITKAMTVDATSLDNGLTIDAAGNDPTPDEDNGDGSRIFKIDDGDDGTDNAVTIRGLTLTGGDGSGDGGAIYARETVTVTSSTISGNSAFDDGMFGHSRGGGIYAHGNVTVTSSTIFGNSVDAKYSRGGGIYAGGNVTIASSAIAGNSATGWYGGGGIYARGAVTVTSSIISGNSGEWGGGIHAAGNVTVTSSRISGNRAFDGCGGGIQAGGNVTVTSSTIAGNSARSMEWDDGCGGGISSYGNVTVTSSTIAGNSADRGGGISSSKFGSCTLTSRNSIIALNEATSDDDVWIGEWVTGASGFNLIGADPHFVRNPSPGADGTWGTADDDYGDLRLTDHSPAIDMGSNALVPPELVTDLDGNNRIHGPRVDIGAYEFQGSPPAGRETPSTLVTTAGDMFDLYDGAISLREAIWHAAAGERVTFSATLDQDEMILGGTSIFVDRSLTIDASTLESFSINADGKSRALTVWANEVELIGLTINGGTADYGGGIWAHGAVTVTSSTISGNSADWLGGGGIRAGGDVTVTSSTISGNQGSGYGGGIRAGGNVTVTASTISGNSAYYGGGVRANGDVTVTASTIARNDAGYYGGGISANGNVTVTSSTISGNSAQWDGGGGIRAGGAVTVTSSTISGNHAHKDGGGIYAKGNAAVTIANSIVADNTDNGAFPDIRPGNAVLTLRHSLIGNNTGTGLTEAPVGMPDADGNLIGDPDGVGIIDPMLGPLAGNGGPTETHALLSGSPAIDAGDPDFAPPPDFDQRGSRRVADGNADGVPRIDMGVFEVLRGDVNGDGEVNGLDVEPFVDVLLSGAEDARADMNADGTVNGLDVAPFVAAVLGGTPALGDVNHDGAVNGLDVDPFVDVLLNGPYNAAADVNEDGTVNGLDVGPFVALVLGGDGSAGVEERSRAQHGLPAINVERDATLAGTSIRSTVKRLHRTSPAHNSYHGNDPPQLIHQRTVEHVFARRSRMGTRIRGDGHRLPPGGVIRHVQHEASTRCDLAVDRAMRDDTLWDQLE